MARYLRKPTEVDAEQFTEEWNPPRGVLVAHLGSGHFEHYVVTAQDRHVKVDVGEWIVREPTASGCFYPVADAEFRLLYEPIGDKL